jgi:hypothetical protein
MNIPECLYEVIGLSNNNCGCIPAIIEIEDAFYSKSIVIEIQETIQQIQLPWDNLFAERLYIILNNTNPILGIHYTVSNNIITFVDLLEPGDNLWIREI